MDLADIYQNQAVKEFGEALGNAIGKEKDYASLTDLEAAQTKEDFADALRRFLRRFHVYAARPENFWYCPSGNRLEELMRTVDQAARAVPRGGDAVRDREAVRLIRAALLSHALTRATYLRVQELRNESRESNSQS